MNDERTSRTPDRDPSAHTAAQDPWTPASDRRPSAAVDDRGPRRIPLFTAAMACTALGVVLTVLAVAVPLATDGSGPTWLYLGAMFFLPVGFLLALVYALLGARAPRQSRA